MKKFEEEYDKFHKENHNMHKTATEYHKALKRHFKDVMFPEDYQSEIEQLKSQLEKHQPEIPEVPQFVADWYEENKEHLEYRIWRYIRIWSELQKDDFYNFMNNNSLNPIETIIAMKNGYTVKGSGFI